MRALLFILLLFTSPVMAASFDCTAPALNSTEQLICTTPALAELDVQMAAQYAATQQTVDNGALRASQRQWISKQQRVCTQESQREAQVACLTGTLQQRLTTLATWAALVQQPKHAQAYETLLYNQAGNESCHTAENTYQIKSCQHKTLQFLQATTQLYLAAAEKAAKATEATYRELDSSVYSAATVLAELQEVQQQWQRSAYSSCAFWSTANPQGTLYPVLANSCLIDSYTSRLALLYQQMLHGNGLALPKVF